MKSKYYSLVALGVAIFGFFQIAIAQTRAETQQLSYRQLEKQYAIPSDILNNSYRDFSEVTEISYALRQVGDSQLLAEYDSDGRLTSRTIYNGNKRRGKNTELLGSYGFNSPGGIKNYLFAK